jgi:DNA adenine methylase
MNLPAQISKVKIPPIKCQGIKTKLVPFILGNISWRDFPGRWIEPFLGSGVVAFNFAPTRALLTDTNKHIIEFYQALQKSEITPHTVRQFLSEEGQKLAEDGQVHYYKVRERFNTYGSPLDFLFLNRSCFNGVMRFNRYGKFNVPFGHKPNRFSRAYITKIANQVGWVAQQMKGKDWVFKASHWKDTLREVKQEDFVYLDPPYIGRHTDYFNVWNEEEAQELAAVALNLSGGFALSMWLENRHRRNDHLDEYWSNCDMRMHRHFYHVGSKENYRNEMQEALVIKPGFSVVSDETYSNRDPLESKQLALFE